MNNVWVRIPEDPDAHWVKLFGYSFTTACGKTLSREKSAKVGTIPRAPAIPNGTSVYLPEAGQICPTCEQKRREQA